MRPISEDEVAERSYRIWEREGRPEGRHLDHWFRARAELEAEAAQQQPQKEKHAAAGGKSGSQSEQLLRILRAG